MRTHATSDIRCALVRMRPPVSGVALRVISSAPSCTQHNRAAIRGDAYHVKPRITCVDRAVIRDYFHQHDLDEVVRPGSMKALISEFRKNLLPDELECRLSPPFPGHERMVVGGDVLLVETATREIVDVMRNARQALHKTNPRIN